jgi:plastocyanin
MLKFWPDTIKVKAGDVVEWTNNDLTPHTATSPGERELESGSINAGASWRHTFSKPGTFAYFCTFHPEMKGVVVVR